MLSAKTDQDGVPHFETSFTSKRRETSMASLHIGSQNCNFNSTNTIRVMT